MEDRSDVRAVGGLDSSREEASSARHGWTSLMWACDLRGHVEIARLLVEKGANLEAQNMSYASSVFLVEAKLRTRFSIA